MEVGGLVGWNYGTIENSYATGEVIAEGSSFVYAGGLVGENRGTISNSYATGEVTATTSGQSVYAGGLAGQSNNIISNSYATGNVTATAEGSSTVYAGGLVGWNYGTIENSYATGEVTATGSGDVYAGGLAGENRGTISNSYATGKVTATGTGRVYAGGLAGENRGTISNSYATGEVTATGTDRAVYAGGFAGWNNTGTITNSYFDSITTGQTRGVGGGTGAGVIARTTPQLQALASAPNWSTNNWDFGNTNQYPALRSYKVNDASPPVQILGDLFCGQPAPRAQCPSPSASPVEFTDAELRRIGQRFVAVARSATQIDLLWLDVGDDYMYYEVYRHTINDSNGATRIAIPLAVNGRTYMDVDTSLTTDTTYYYWLKACPADAMVMCSDFFAHTQATTP